MRILLATGIYPPDAGGPASYTRAFARALSIQGHDVQVVCYGDEDGITAHDGYPVERVARRSFLPIRYWRFLRAVRRRAPLSDVVYLQGPVSEGLPGTIGAIGAGKPTVMKVVGDYAWEAHRLRGGTERLDAFLARRHGTIGRIERWTAKRAKRVIVPSEYLKGVVMKWGVSSQRVTVIHNAIEPLPSTQSREDVRARLGVQHRRVILTVVRAVPWKNIDFLIGLLPELSADTLLVVVGDGPSINAWKERAASLGIQDRIRWPGRLDRAETADWYRAANVFALPSGYEGFPHVVVEAASLGLPCVVSDRGGNPEMYALLGPEYVTVAPYLDNERWREALQAAEMPATPCSSIPTMHDMVERTLATLQSAV